MRLRGAAACRRLTSNDNNESVKRLRRDRKLILFQSGNVLLDRITGVLDRFLSSGALRNASRKAWTLSDPLPILSSADYDLAHGSDFGAPLSPSSFKPSMCI